MVESNKSKSPTFSAFKQKSTRSRKVAPEPTVSRAVPKPPAPETTTAKRPRHQIKFINTDQPQTSQVTWKRNRLQSTSPVRKKSTKSGTKRPSATSARRPLLAKSKSTDNPPRISKGPEIAKISSDEIPNSSDLVSFELTDPEEAARRKKRLHIPEGHKLIHVLRHAT